MTDETKKTLNAYEILFSYTVSQPGSITIPGYDAEDAKQRLQAFLNEAGGYNDLKIGEVVDLKESPTFKQMVAYHALSYEQEKAYFDKWLAQADSPTSAVEDAEIIDVPAKVLN